MARHGENIRKRKDGRWEGRFLVYNEKKEKKIYQSVYAWTYEEVKRKLAIQKNLSTNVIASTENQFDSLYALRFHDIADEWLREIKKSRKQSTYLKYSTIYHTHIEQKFKEAVFSDMTDAFVEKKISEHLSESVYKSIYCVLNQIFKFAYRKYAVVLPVLKKPAHNSRKKPVKAFTQNEQKRLVLVLCQDMNPFKMAVLMCLFTGLRLGEVCALKWSDIDFENRILMIQRTVQRLPVEGKKTKTSLVETAPKSESSLREIPLSETVMELFIHFRNNREYVLGGDKPLDPRTLQNHFKKILNEAGLEDKNFHILRHTFSTNCIEEGVDVKSLSEMLGHSDVQITLNRYVHPSMTTKRQYMDHLSRVYGQICGQVS